MDTTWAVISWSVPSFIPTDYFIKNYELGYNVLQSHDCSMMDFESIDIQMNGQFRNVSVTITQISNLMSSTCYIFAVRAYTINGYSEWVYTTNKTLPGKSGKSLIYIQKLLHDRFFSHSYWRYCRISCNHTDNNNNCNYNYSDYYLKVSIVLLLHL